jgi:anti-sigma factor RsiW
MNDRHLTPDEIVDYLHGELPITRDAAVAMHLAQCRTCAEAREAEAALTEMVRAVAQKQERTVPSAMMSSIRAAAERPPQRASRPFWFARPLVALPVALAAGLAIWLGMRSFTVNPPKPSIAAGYLVDRHAITSAIAPFADDAPIPPVFASDNAPR